MPVGAATTLARLYLRALTYEGILLSTEEVVRSIARPLIEEDALLAGVSVRLARFPLSLIHSPPSEPLPLPLGYHEAGSHPEGVSCT